MEAVVCIQSSIIAFRESERRPLLPRTTNLTSFFISVGSSSFIALTISSIRVWTSSSGRPQFSSEKANSERYFTPSSTAASVHARTLSTPAACPNTRSLPRSPAHRPFPSMIIDTWHGIIFLSSSIRLLISAVSDIFPPEKLAYKSIYEVGPIKPDPLQRKLCHRYVHLHLRIRLHHPVVQRKYHPGVP